MSDRVVSTVGYEFTSSVGVARSYTLPKNEYGALSYGLTGKLQISLIKCGGGNGLEESGSTGLKTVESWIYQPRPVVGL